MTTITACWKTSGNCEWYWWTITQLENEDDQDFRQRVIAEVNAQLLLHPKKDDALVQMQFTWTASIDNLDRSNTQVQPEDEDLDQFMSDALTYWGGLVQEQPRV